MTSPETLFIPNVSRPNTYSEYNVAPNPVESILGKIYDLLEMGKRKKTGKEKAPGFSTGPSGEGPSIAVDRMNDGSNRTKPSTVDSATDPDISHTNADVGDEIRNLKDTFSRELAGIRQQQEQSMRDFIAHQTEQNEHFWAVNDRLVQENNAVFQENTLIKSDGVRMMDDFNLSKQVNKDLIKEQGQMALATNNAYTKLQAAHNENILLYNERARLLAEGGELYSQYNSLVENYNKLLVKDRVSEEHINNTRDSTYGAQQMVDGVLGFFNATGIDSTPVLNALAEAKKTGNYNDFGATFSTMYDAAILKQEKKHVAEQEYAVTSNSLAAPNIRPSKRRLEIEASKQLRTREERREAEDAKHVVKKKRK
ncbi:MAG: hypothetical protein V4708_17450 [Bacteroidota bacterium]